MGPQEFDVCRCGDYRHQHRRRDTGTLGPCLVCVDHDSYSGGRCHLFREHMVVTYAEAR